MGTPINRVRQPLVKTEFEVEKPVSEYIRDWALFNPERIALRYYGWDMTYAGLDEAVNRFANGLIDLGLEKGDRVALYLQNCPQFVISFFGIMRAGGVVVSLNPMFKQGELEFEINDAGAGILVAHDYLYPEVLKIKDSVGLEHAILCSLSDYIPKSPALPLPEDARLPKQSFPDTFDFQKFIENAAHEPVCRIHELDEELALLQYTGGTTGLPKGAMISHHTLAYTCLGTISWFKHRYGDVFLGLTPFFHVMGMQQLMCTPLVAGAELVLMPRFDPAIAAKAIETFGVTFWVTATTSLIALLETPGIDQYNFSSLRILGTGGTPISTTIQEKIRDLSPKTIVVEGYGLSECTSHGGFQSPVMCKKPGYIGIAQLNKVKLVDPSDGKTPVAIGEQGEILIKGPTVMKGYWNNPEATWNTLRDGWLFTGDLGIMDEDGWFNIVGRKKELIKCSGFSVFPSEVENLLYRNPAVLEVGVIGVPDPYRGESPKAFIVLKPEYRDETTEEEIIEWCKDNMSAYKRPREVTFVSDLPKSAAGKLLRRVLTEQEEAHNK